MEVLHAGVGLVEREEAAELGLVSQRRLERGVERDWTGREGFDALDEAGWFRHGKEDGSDGVDEGMKSGNVLICVTDLMTIPGENRCDLTDDRSGKA